ncbi:hypothetical protein DPX16_1210 [Anabarilius grahami]|uniref:Ig-like domain-containing protein n=1 Tax=Anabarilius grahami TaxID=495550 RepID=A0A3N0XVX7_ANAGA|nr:hypothetical protein DPX16_1210 [Anabarilius grahami]
MADQCDLCLLGLIILSSLLTGTSGVDDENVFISSGENVRLPCNNALSDCKSTTWTYYNRFRGSAAVKLIVGGIKKKDTERHERLSLGSDCSLNIKNVTEEDSGSYFCRQYVNDKQQGTDASVSLHVLHDHCIITLTTTLLNEDDNREWRCQLTLRNQLQTSVRYTVKYSVIVIVVASFAVLLAALILWMIRRKRDVKTKPERRRCNINYINTDSRCHTNLSESSDCDCCRFIGCSPSCSYSLDDSQKKRRGEASTPVPGGSGPTRAVTVSQPQAADGGDELLDDDDVLSLTSSDPGASALLAESPQGQDMAMVEEEGAEAASFSSKPPCPAYVELLEVVERAAGRLQLPSECVRKEPVRGRLDEQFLSDHNPVIPVSLPFLPDLHTEVRKAWKNPYSARIHLHQQGNFADVEGLGQHGYVSMPPIDETFANYLATDNRRGTDDSEEQTDDHVTYSEVTAYSKNQEQKNKVRCDDKVTYASIRGAKAGSQENCSELYASVNKNHHKSVK